MLDRTRTDLGGEHAGEALRRLIFDCWTRIAAYRLALHTMLATLTFRAYWAASDAATAANWQFNAWRASA